MIARKSLLIMGSRILMSLTGFVSWYFITHYVSIDFTSSVGFAIAYLGLFGLLTDLGFSNAHVRRIAEGKDIGRCVGTYIFIKLILISAYAGVVMFSFYFYQSIYPQRDFANSYDQKVVMLMLVWSILSLLSNVPVQTFLGRQQIAKAQTAIVISAVIQAIVTIPLVMRYNDVFILAATWIVGAALFFIIAWAMFLGTPIKLPNKEYLKSYTIFALPLMFVAGAQPVALFIDRVMLKLFVEDTAVGIYWNAQKFAQLPDQVTAAVATVLFPALTALVATKSFSEVKKKTLQAERYLSMLIFPISLTLVALAQPFIYIFTGPQYESSYVILIILMGWATVKTLARPYSTHFLAFDRTKYFMVTSSTFLITIIITNLICIPDDIYGVKLLGLGAPGAAVATLVTSIVNYVVIRYLSSRIIKMKFNRSIPKHVFAAGIPAIILVLTQMFLWEVSRFYELIFFAGVAGLMYLGILILIKEFKKADMDFFLDTINMKKMFYYYWEEVIRKNKPSK